MRLSEFLFDVSAAFISDLLSKNKQLIHLEEHALEDVGFLMQFLLPTVHFLKTLLFPIIGFMFGKCLVILLGLLTDIVQSRFTCVLGKRFLDFFFVYNGFILVFFLFFCLIR
jgi:hypothetical protein